MNSKLNIFPDMSNLDMAKYFTQDSYDKALAIMCDLRKGTGEYTGWVNYPSEIDDEKIREITVAASHIRSMCDVLVVIGIGGSYLGTAAILEAVGGPKKGCPEIIYAGNSISGTYMNEVLNKIKNRDFCICVVSKSGNTMETGIAFQILKKELNERYGEEALKRIIAITDADEGILRQEVNENGYMNFDIPANIGGRYSAFTPAIIFPLAVAGVDIKELIRGAAVISHSDEFWIDQGLKYPIARYELMKRGSEIEILEFFEPSLRLIGEWCKQLFGESEGKQGKGLFPTSLIFSTDLHSMGQFLQEGNQIFFETVIDIKNAPKDVIIPDTAGKGLAGRSMNYINRLAVSGVTAAHKNAGIEIIRIQLEDLTAYSIGQLLYFLMVTSAVTGKLMKINPFNQDGVEKYKSEIRKLLNVK